VTLTDGRAHEIRHPDPALVLRGSVVIGVPTKDQPDEYGSFTTISLLRVRHIEYLDAKKGPDSHGGNGKKKPKS